jgi:ComF family protein
MRSAITSLARDFVNLIYPELCCACGAVLNEDENLICLHCEAELPRTNFHTFRENPMERVFWGRVPIQKAASYVYFQKSSHVQDVMHRIKYKGIKEAAHKLGSWYGRELSETGFLKDVDMLIPVPLHRKKQRQRGFNQSEWLANGISDTTGIPVNTTALAREQWSETQTRKGRYLRWQNVEGIFVVKDATALENKHVVIIDDVITTGATLESCVRKILDLNCNARVSVLTLAYAGGI